MSALIVRLGPVRNAVDQAQRLGNPEPRESIVARIVRDIRAGHHPYRVPLQLVRPTQGSAA
jgi:hypothetical protein